MKIALIQFNAGLDKNDNIARAFVFVRRAVENGAQFVLLPEIYNFRGDVRDQPLVACVSEKVPGASVEPFMKLARAKGVFILAGSVFEKAPGGKAYNTSVLIDDRGRVAAKYRKIHLFDARLGGQAIRESDCFCPGRIGIKARVGKFTVGLSVCYDLRFPDLYLGYGASGVDIITVPSCFTKKTGQAHWEILLRARAIENLCYVLASNQVGMDARGIAAYGNSMVVGPWGNVIARGSDNKEEIVYAQIKMEEIKKARAVLPGIIKRK
ncbi:MAG: carbon-nitrogen hydrolase family protein [Candidatus Omnitrophota bacterium]|nr:carbon-nitrogen hydrolase family protein [Candidatus Omnitrophota bacterium]